MSNPHRGPNQDATLFWCSLALIAVAISCGMITPLLMLRRLIPLDPNEGWNAFFSNIALTSGNLYPSDGSLVGNSYPPLSFYVVGFVGLWTGDNILAGRDIALISMLIVAANLYFWLRMTGSASQFALLGAAIFLGFAVTYGETYVAMDDPQWLAHAIMTTGLVVLWRGQASTRAIIAGSILMIAAGWTKHLLIPIPIAVTFVLMKRSKAAFITWMVCSGTLLTMSCLLLWWAYGATFFQSLQAGRQYSVHHAWVATATACRCFAPLLGLSLLLWASKHKERVVFVATYLIAAAAIGAIASGRAGIDVNAFFDLLIATSLGASLASETLWSGDLWSRFWATDPDRAPLLGRIAIVLLAVCTLGYAVTKVPRSIVTIRNLGTLEQTTASYIGQLRRYGHGHAACEMLGLCYWANSSFAIDFFNYGQKMQRGAYTGAPCESLFRDRTIPIIQLQSMDHRAWDLLPDKCNRALYENYRSVASSDLGVLLVPRER